MDKTIRHYTDSEHNDYVLTESDSGMRLIRQSDGEVTLVTEQELFDFFTPVYEDNKLHFDWCDYPTYSDGSQSTHCYGDVYLGNTKLGELTIEDHTLPKAKEYDAKNAIEVYYAYVMHDSMRIHDGCWGCHGFDENDHRNSPFCYSGTTTHTLEDVKRQYEEDVCKAMCFDYDKEFADFTERLNRRRDKMNAAMTYLSEKAPTISPTVEECAKFCDAIKSNIQIMSSEWALSTIPCSDDCITPNIIRALNIIPVLADNNVFLDIDEIKNDNNEIHINVVWDELESDKICSTLGRYKGELRLSDMLPASFHDELTKIGYDALKKHAKQVKRQEKKTLDEKLRGYANMQADKDRKPKNRRDRMIDNE